MNGNPFSDIPPEVRRWSYVVYTLLLIALGAVQVGYGTSSADTPEWLEVAFAVLGYLGIAFGFTAASNVGHEDPWAAQSAAIEVDEPYEYDEEDDETILSEIDPTPDHLDEGEENVGAEPVHTADHGPATGAGSDPGWRGGPEGTSEGQPPGGGGAGDPRGGGPLPGAGYPPRRGL